MLKWKLAEYLRRENVTPYAVMKEAKLAPNTLYQITRGRSRTARLETLEAIMTAVHKLTGSPISVCDILEYQEPKSAASKEVV